MQLDDERQPRQGDVLRQVPLERQGFEQSLDRWQRLVLDAAPERLSTVVHGAHLCPRALTLYAAKGQGQTLYLVRSRREAAQPVESWRANELGYLVIGATQSKGTVEHARFAHLVAQETDDLLLFRRQDVVLLPGCQRKQHLENSLGAQVEAKFWHALKECLGHHGHH